MTRSFFLRGEREIEEFEDVLAIKPTERSTDPRDLEAAFGEIANPQILPKESVVFAKAGWVFVHPNSQLTGALRAGQVPNGLLSIHRIFLNRGSQIHLGADRLVVRLKEDVGDADAEGELSKVGLKVLFQPRFARNLFLVQVQPGNDFLETSVNLSTGTNRFEFAEPEFLEHIGPRFVPKDPDFGQQWHLRNAVLAGAGRPPIAGVSAVKAWDTTRGAGVCIAVIDNAIDVNHQDFVTAVSGKSGYFVSDGAHGANFVQGTGGFPAGEGHGTFCAGLAVAQSNTYGGCGVANQATLMAIACLEDEVGSQMTLARAIAYAANPSVEGVAGPGADVICCSLGSGDSDKGDWDISSVLQAAIHGAFTGGRGSKGTPVFWATNDHHVLITNDRVCSYENTIAVGISDRNDKLGNSDNGGCAYGPELAFLATGEDVYSTVNGDGYDTASGTSYAAPVAAGIAALMLAANSDLTSQQVRDFLQETATRSAVWHTQRAAMTNTDSAGSMPIEPSSGLWPH
jgi:subtilisin family serine protease